MLCFFISCFDVVQRIEGLICNALYKCVFITIIIIIKKTGKNITPVGLSIAKTETRRNLEMDNLLPIPLFITNCEQFGNHKGYLCVEF